MCGAAVHPYIVSPPQSYPMYSTSLSWPTYRSGYRRLISTHHGEALEEDDWSWSGISGWDQPELLIPPLAGTMRGGYIVVNN